MEILRNATATATATATASVKRAASRSPGIVYIQYVGRWDVSVRHWYFYIYIYIVFVLFIAIARYGVGSSINCVHTVQYRPFISDSCLGGIAGDSD